MKWIDREIPDILPEIKHVYISDEKYQKMMSLFSINPTIENIQEVQNFLNQPERLNPKTSEEDAIV